ncbi:MAG TPA: two-component regulator propeller domain-containing protein [Bryobacteraceae bacterium]|nr:two-component regulator propeller domain-containing protein [Bryobacteraceae bacterium]
MKSSNFFLSSRFGRAVLLRLTAVVIASTFISPATFAIDPDRAMSQYVHDRWGPEQGFPLGPVYGIAQSGDGYLWIGTEAGLVRFDGWDFRLIKDDSGAFTIGSVLGLASDENGCLWLRLQDLSIVRYCNGVFQRPSGDQRFYTRIETMSQSNRGALLVWKAEGGAFGFRGRNFERIASATDLPPSPVISVAQAGNGDVWMGTRDAGLFRDRHGQTLSIRRGLPDLKINCLLPAGDQSLWIGTDDGIVRWDGAQITSTGIPKSLRHFQALALVADRDRNVWVGTDSRGLLRLNRHGVTRLNLADTASPQAVTALFEDREGSLWIGHADGIERLRDSAFVTYSLAEGLPTDGSNPVYVDSESRMWFAPVKGGLWWVKDNRHGRVNAGGLNQDVVYSMAGAGGELWLGRQHGGLTELRLDHQPMIAKAYTHADGLAQNSIYSVYLARDGTVWAGTLSAGVSRLRDGKFKNFTIANGLASNTVVSMLEDSDGTMWFATPNGVSALAGARWASYGSADGLPSANINCFLQDSAGVLWVGTASGIAFWNHGRFQVPASLPLPLRAQILGLAEDRLGSLWVATSNGVLRVNRQKLLDGILGDGDVREFGLADGLRGIEGVKRHRSVMTDPAGRIWFSLNRGISVVDPARLSRNTAPALPQVQVISADGDRVPFGPSIHISDRHQRITFAYSGLSLSVPDRVRYRYRLEGFDQGWSELEAARDAVYTNLPPGQYRFEVKATNPDGIWSAGTAAVDFEVDPQYWQTWWFRLSVTFGCLGCVLALYWFRLRQMTQRINLRFQERLAERTRIAQELHDTLLQGFLSASMQVHVAADRLPEDSTVKPILTRALELMGQVIEEGRNAVRGLRSSRSASLDLELAFSRIQHEFAAGEPPGDDIGFRVIVDGERRPLHPILRDEVYRIGREALMNAFRHAHAKNIEMELRYSSNRFRILVRDDGCGIDPNILRTGRDGHWGLSGMRERADRIGAQFHVLSNVSAGTEIELSVPGSVAFQDEPSPRSWFGKWPARVGAKRRVSSQNGKSK